MIIKCIVDILMLFYVLLVVCMFSFLLVEKCNL